MWVSHRLHLFSVQVALCIDIGGVVTLLVEELRDCQEQTQLISLWSVV